MAHLGEYELHGEVGRFDDRVYFEAFQPAINRRVILVLLDPEAGGQEHIDEMLATVRLRASHPAPFLAAVYEAQAEADQAFYTCEMLGGQSLAELIREGRPLQEREMVRLVDGVVGVSAELESRGVAMRRLRDWHIFLDPEAGWRMFHPAVVGPIDPGQVIGAIELLLTAAQLLLPDGSELTRGLQEASGRLATGEISDWAGLQQVWADYRRQWGGRMAAPTSRRRSSLPWIWLAAGTVTLAVVGIVLGLLVLRERSRRALPPLEPPRVVRLERDGQSALWMDEQEVSIAAFAHFLAAKEKAGAGQVWLAAHSPARWPEIIRAAAHRTGIDGRPVGYDSPVFLVDYADAEAFATWRGGRLPSEEEWIAAAQGGPEQAATGVLGLDGEVAEWTSTRATSSRNPGLEVPVVCGGDFSHPDSDASTRRTALTAEESSLFVGFRLVYDELPDEAVVVGPD